MFHLPVIAENDYPALVKEPGSFFPRNYAGWALLSDELCAMRGSDGIARIEVKPADFFEFMKSTGQRPGLQALLDFAAFNPWHDPDC